MPASSSPSRPFWIETTERLARPVLTHLANGTLRQQMPIEMKPGATAAASTHLEALGRLLAGLAPWLESGGPEAEPWADLARRAIDSATDPASPDACNFDHPWQALVDTAFLAQSLLRAPQALAGRLEDRVRENIIIALRKSRGITPCFNNWLLFSALVEAGLWRLGADWDRVRVDYALRTHETWYKGDGIYGDGPHYHADYYNAFVIQPMLVDLVDHLPMPFPSADYPGKVVARAIRHAAIQERMISPEGTFPPVGRSLAYRFGALQGLAQMALRKTLPEGVTPGQARGALTAVIRRMIEAPGTFDEAGWLKIGFCGAQPGIGEGYISTGSLYLCSVGLLPLGLPESAPFWSDADEPWTSVKAWNGGAFPIDKSLAV